jgi:tetratricopeptide (TPR) repeat protein
MDPTSTARTGGITAAVPQRVFLSHTSDLGKPDQPGSFVAAAVAAVNRARHAVTDMAYFAARATSSAAVCVDMVAQSDVYVGIIGLRYGSLVRDRDDVSYTELEFEAAGERGQPRLIFLIREDSDPLPPAGEPLEMRARQVAFRRRLLDAGLTAAEVGSPAELEVALLHALMELAPTPDAPARLAAAQALLASMPTDALPPRAALPAGSRMPLAPNPLFVGRGHELLQVAAALQGGDTTVALGQVVASTGLGGLGKTQLAVELVHRYGRFFAGGVFWLSFASADEIPLQVAACAGPGAIDLAPGIEDQPMEQRVERVRRAWQSAEPRLLVFDNCEEEALLDAWRPPSGGCRVLVTSRRSQWSPTLGVTALPLDLLPRPDSIDLLRRYRPDLAPDDPGLDSIAAELGDLPLALHLAGSYLRAYRAEVSLDEYLAELRQPDVVRHASLLGAGIDDSPSPTHHVQSVAQTFALCLGRLDREREVDQVAIALLARMACMAPGEPVPRDLLAKTLEDVDPLLRADALRRLGAVGLVEEGEGGLRLHRLLAHFVQCEVLDPGAQTAVDRTLISCGVAAAEGDLTGLALRAVIPHVLTAVGAPDADHNLERVAALSNAAAQALHYTGEFAAARPWYERVLTVRQQVLGPDHPGTAASLNNLALLLRERGELAAARPLLERALAIRERVLGPDHPDTAASLNNLARLLHGLAEHAAARPLLERAFAIWERTLGPDHPQTALGMNNLALLLRAQGQLVAARPLLERALAIREHVLGPEHPFTTYSLNGLAGLLQAQGDLAAAQPLYERALTIKERVLGPVHPQTALGLYNLALLLRDRGEGAAARPLLERALGIRERVLGPDHPSTALSLNDLALLLRDQGDPAAARPLFERALAIRERVLGPDHPDTVATSRALAELAAKGDGPRAGG